MSSFDYIDLSYLSKGNICGIINYGANCYLNSGLQIIASCQELISELNKIHNSKNIIPHVKNAILSLLTQKEYNPKKFIEYFCYINSDFNIGSAGCSQNFIRTLIRNINSDCLFQNGTNITKNFNYFPSEKELSKYNRFLLTNRIYPESNIQSIFSCITKSYSKGKCMHCYEDINDFSFSYSLDLNIYLDEIHEKTMFSKVLDLNIGRAIKLTTDCPKCGIEICLDEVTKFIKLPEIIIFTLERYQGNPKRVEIIPDPVLYMDTYIDKNLKENETNYELFAINIRFGKTLDYGHEICQVKRGGIWYEINDRTFQKLNCTSHNDYSYGLFYRKMKKNKIINNGHKEIISGLEIIALFDEFKKELNNFPNKKNDLINLINDVINDILYNRIYNSKNISKLTILGKNSQEFIINVINEIDKEFTKNKIFDTACNYQVSKIFSIFSTIFECQTNKICLGCKRRSNCHYVNYQIDNFIQSDDTNTNFNNLLKNNYKIIVKQNKLCPICHQTEIEENKKEIVKLPEILIFTMDNRENKIRLANIIDMDDYCKDSLRGNGKYGLFAVNFYNNNCIIKKNEKWYEISDKENIEIDFPIEKNYINGLFYKKLKSKIKHF